ncbi:hypothetical protein DYB25_005813 [Aphanomyces astaci]|uniref:NADP-dependent oxidoreductase domain-containing protein n=1 Tax=Aphanomyces astaci TaxID=112090 RepID=A0A397BML7_APHAT|nr:hypothetical protein DYB25_005813 [Aphanomyces astaci]
MKLATGADIPDVAIGTYRLRGDDAERVVYDALCVGYRHIDTAAVYRNEVAVGRAIRRAIDENILTRPELFVTTKVSPKHMGYAKTVEAIQVSLRDLGLDYIDLMLLHWPGTQGKKADSPLQLPNRVGSMQALTEAFNAGTLKAVGVSNYLRAHFVGLDHFPIHVNQVEFHPLQWTAETHELVGYCRRRHMVMAAYSSLGEGSLLDDVAYPELAHVARQVGAPATVAQVLLAWGHSHGWVVIPKASSKARIQENWDATRQVTLSDEHMASINAIVDRVGPVKFCWDPSVIA